MPPSCSAASVAVGGSVSPSIWNELLTSTPQPSIYQTPAWLEAVCAAGGYSDVSRLFELPGGRRALLPLISRPLLPPFLRIEQSLPHGWGCGGILSDGPLSADDLRAIFECLSGEAAARRVLRPGPLRAALWERAAPASMARRSHQVHVLDLHGGFDAVWSQRFGSATRTKIRKAEKAGIAVERQSLAQGWPLFQQLYLSWAERRSREGAMPAFAGRLAAARREPAKKLRVIAERLGSACTLWLAHVGNELAAAAITLTFGCHATYWRSASDKHLAGPTRANDLLQKLMIEEACASGCRYYHMGESGGVESLMHFKSRFGAEPLTYQEYRFGWLPALASSSGRRRAARKPAARYVENVELRPQEHP